MRARICLSSYFFFLFFPFFSPPLYFPSFRRCFRPSLHPFYAAVFALVCTPPAWGCSPLKTRQEGVTFSRLVHVSFVSLPFLLHGLLRRLARKSPWGDPAMTSGSPSPFVASNERWNAPYLHALRDFAAFFLFLRDLVLLREFSRSRSSLDGLISPSLKPFGR